jgi:hypothetical protein
MNLYFQFLTQNQSASAIELIQLPALLVSGQAIAGKTKMSTGGKLMHSKFSSIETLSAKLAKTRFNELEVIYDIKKLKIGMTTAQVENLNGVFYPSTTGELWFSWKNFEPLEDRRGHQRKMMAKGDEEAVACHRVSLMPCVFEVALEIETSKSQKQVLDNCAEWLANSIGKIFGELKVFGCCDAGGIDFHVRLEAYVPMIASSRIMARTHPKQYPELGKKIDDLHPIMFGAKQVYSELAVALGKDAKLICGTGASDFAVIRLNTKCDITAAKERAKNWLLPTIR